MSDPGGGSGKGPPPGGRPGYIWPPPGQEGQRTPSSPPHQPAPGQPLQRQPPPPYQQPQPYQPPQPQQPYPPQQPYSPQQPSWQPPGARQPPAPYPRDRAAPYPPAQDPHAPAQEPEAASTMLGWQASQAQPLPPPPHAGQDPAWAHGMQRAMPLPPSPAESAPLNAPPSLVGLVGLALRRAFRAYVDPREVTEAERAALESATPPITDPDVQGFLVWRHSLHLVVAIAIVPLLVFMVVDLARAPAGQGSFKFLTGLQLVVDIAFAALLWVQLRNWTQWQKQRRILGAGWLAFFLMPFVIFLYPLRSAFPDQGNAIAYGMVASVVAMLQLTPKAISLMPGLLRAAITSKLLFPGASGPGWLVLILAPIYSVLLYVVLIIPYQLTGNAVFVPAMIGLIGSQVWLGRMGYKLARPERLEEALVLVRKVRATYVALNLAGLLFVTIGLWDLLEQLQLGSWAVVHVLLSLLVNVLLLTLVATDQIVANLVRGQRLLRMPGTGEAQAAFAQDIAHFDDEPRAPG